MTFLAPPDQRAHAVLTQTGLTQTGLTQTGPTQTGLAQTGDNDRAPPAAHPPVFLHCGWRTRGTWIWNRFRGLDGVAGFYEPLAEPLAQLRADTLAERNAQAWPSGHVGLDRPYFDEFRPLLRADRPGVPGYQARFASEDFFAAPDAALPELEAWLRSLLRLAESRGEQPVLKFSRSTGRIGWMRRTFPDAVHIVVMRDPFTQFASALRQFVCHGNAYFLAMPLMLLAINQAAPPVADALRHLEVEFPVSNTVGLAAWEARLRDTDPAAWYRGSLAFWVATAATIPDSVDLVIDGDALTGARSRRRPHEAALASLTGRAVDFSDAEASSPAPRADALGLRRSGLLAAHAAAEAFLAEQCGPYWADAPVLSHVARLLTRARAHGLGDDLAWRARQTNGPIAGDGEPDAVAGLLSATVRATKAEQELAAMRASHSWKVTAPLRWLSRSARVA